jgi:hypothetical protein
LPGQRGIAVIDKVAPRACRTIARRRDARSAHRVGLAALVAAFVLGSSATAQPEYDGHFEVRSGVAEFKGDVLYLDAIIDLQLSTEATEALRSDFTLTIAVEVEVLHRLRLWWDLAEIPTVIRRSQLTYDQLTDRYVVRSMSTGDRDPFNTLAGALAFIGRIDDFPVTSRSLLDPDRRYSMRVRAVLDSNELPGPLRLLAIWRKGWSIESDWLEWRLDLE